jgi:GNAT superfamily N-acetyltransferase
MEAARPATEADVPRLAELCRVALSELGPARGGRLFVTREARTEPLEAGFADDVRAADRLVLAGTYDDVVVGYAAAGLEVLRDGTTLGIVRDLFVEPPAREVGVGEALMADVLSWCSERGCIGVDAHALPGERLTKNFFEASGFTARLLVMHHRLDRSPAP